MIASNLKILMKEKKVTVRALQEQTGRALETLQRARGPLIRECRLSTLEAIAGALGVKVKDLFEEVEE
ncbi:helix-turn-helix domain-containing protein [Desulfovibrio legallii]|uniref:helix-turn-helix domain-containing protein n=1 Tax=Desulfovibrio legallii TaxID=571438 RepID=UPI000B80F4DE|nr:helix-turn-helix transcriptional regulator [Desulfovibrio legallii]